MFATNPSQGALGQITWIGRKNRTQILRSRQKPVPSVPSINQPERAAYHNSRQSQVVEFQGNEQLFLRSLPSQCKRMLIADATKRTLPGSLLGQVNEFATSAVVNVFHNLTFVTQVCRIQTWSIFLIHCHRFHVAPGGWIGCHLNSSNPNLSGDDKQEGHVFEGRPLQSLQKVYRLFAQTEQCNRARGCGKLPETKFRDFRSRELRARLCCALLGRSWFHTCERSQGICKAPRRERCPASIGYGHDLVFGSHSQLGVFFFELSLG